MRTLLMLILPFLILTACTGRQEETTQAAHDHEQAGTYTCPVHPQVIQDKPGTCPVCGMDLVKAQQSGASENNLMLTDTQIKLANIVTARAGRRPVGETVVINGRLGADQENSQVVSSRASGRVEKLFIKETGRHVRRGEPLYVLYSESLLTLQQEYMLAKEQYEQLGQSQTRYQSFLKAAEAKLLRYGLTKKQIQDLNRERALQPRITFLSPASGIVTEISVAEGQSIPEGGTIYRIEDISSLWVEAELYSNEIALIKPGDKITVKVVGFENSPMDAEVTFLSPEYRANSQITVMRAEIGNPDLQFKPGQQVQIYFTHSSHDAIAIPVDAVIRDQNGTHVYVQSGPNTFQPRMVKTGLEGFDFVEITEGLREEDTVAISGAYLLYSEIILKKGSDPMAGHNH
jgi:Cu(I)/Ag(I) efflux system membrane fusion protein